MTFQELMDCYKINENENNNIVYGKLLKMFQKQNITPVIGAGISCWVYPLWGKLLEKLATGYGLEHKIKELLNNNHYEDAASLLESKITHNELARQLQQKFLPSLIKEKADDCPEYLRSIPRLFSTPIVTTNFDQVIEYLFSQQNIFEFDTITPLDKNPLTKVINALAIKKPILIKMHGDIKDSGHLVLTKEAYDNTYGTDPEHPDFSLPMPSTLKHILEHNPALFLGCSLSADRTCSVIRSCTLEYEQFAFLELPEETYNEANPYRPILYGSDGELIEAFRRRREDIIDKLNICAIWYPYGMHNEAYSSLFSRLSEESGNALTTDFTNDINYTLFHPLFGRNPLVDKISKKIMKQSSICVWVDGPAGIGKTEVCKAVYANLKKKYSSLAMPFIDITGISNLSAFFDAVAKETHISIPNPIVSNDVPEYLLKKLTKKYSLHLSQDILMIIYFDNWEDIWYGLKKKEDKESLIQWLLKLMHNKIRILISSRTPPPTAFDCYNCHVEPLDYGKLDIALSKQETFDRLYSVKLFCHVLHRDIAPKEKKVFRKLIEQLEGHPLAIVLAARQAQREISLADMLDRWDKAWQDPIGMRNVHKSLAVALRVSWNAIKINKEAVIQWGLFYYSLRAIPADVFQKLREDSAEEPWREGLRILLEANLVYVTQDREAIAMLIPLKKQFDCLVAPDKSIQEICLIKWVVYIEELLDMAGKQLSAKRLVSHRRVVEFAPQIFYIMEQLMTFETALPHQYLDQIVKKVRYYYQFYVQSEALLKRLIDYYKENDSAGLLPIVLEDYGNLMRRLGNLDRAKKAYDNAEPLYRKENDNRGMANLLKSKGDLLRRQGNLNAAKESYDEAEKRYRQDGDNLGLANLLKSRGDLLRRLQDLTGAKMAYHEAKLLYHNERNECDNLGLADLLKAQGDLLCQLKSLDDAQKVYDEAEKLYRDELDNLGLANLLKSRGDLLRQQNMLDKALKIYNTAIQLYPKDEDSSGLSDLLKSRDDLQHRLSSK